MANVYVRSGAGGAGSGADWANAYTTLAAACAAKAAGDTFYVSEDHAESQASAMTIACPGTAALPCRILCVDHAGSVPPVSADLRTTATITTTGGNSLSLTGRFYCEGITFNCGTGGSAASLNTANAETYYKNCKLKLLNTAASSLINLAPNGNSKGVFDNCEMLTSAAGQKVALQGTRCVVKGGSRTYLTTSPTDAYTSNSRGCVVDGVDLSSLNAAVNLIASGTSANNTVIRNCKLPASWSGSVCGSTNEAIEATMYNCDSGDTNYRLQSNKHAGAIFTETTLVKTGGASDGDTPLSWKMETNATAEYPLMVLLSPEIFSERITSVGSAKTITVDILHDSATALKDDEIWLEVQYLGTSGFPLGAFANDSKADVLAAAADQTASSATWTTTGMANPNKQKLAVTFTPQEKGVAIVTVCMAKASYTAYVDPVAQVS